MSVAGHLRTVGALVERTAFPRTPPPSERWTTHLEDPASGTVQLTGRLSLPTGARDVVVLVHGLGGSNRSEYLARTATVAGQFGIASLRLNLRGADGEGHDFYHGGLAADLHATATELAGRDFERILILGFSLGGHVALRFATEVTEQKVAAVGAVCSPLDLRAGADAIDRPHMAPYRRYVLGRLKRNYERTSRLGNVPTPPEDLRHVTTIREWDALTVVPRFGFESPDDYYAKASVASRLDRLRVPALLVAAEDDPMIPPTAIRPALADLQAESSTPPGEASHGLLRVRWAGSGGHLGFSGKLNLGFGDRQGIAPQVLSWLLGETEGSDRVP